MMTPRNTPELLQELHDEMIAIYVKWKDAPHFDRSDISYESWLEIELEAEWELHGT